MNVLRSLVAAVCCVTAVVAHADIYKCVDDAGHVTYTNDKPPAGQKGCSVLTRELPVSTVPAPKRPAQSATPADFPKVDDSTQKSRDNDRRKILEQELATEEKALDDARKALAEQEAVRTGGERNYAKFLERVQPYRDNVQLHERNVESLKKEISSLK